MHLKDIYNEIPNKIVVAERSDVFFFVIKMSHMHKIYTKVDHDRTETEGLWRETEIIFFSYYRICLVYSFRKRERFNMTHALKSFIYVDCIRVWCDREIRQRTVSEQNKPHVVTIFAKNILSLLIKVSFFLFIICFVINTYTVFLHNYDIVIQMTSQN